MLDVTCAAVLQNVGTESAAQMKLPQEGMTMNGRKFEDADTTG